MTRLESGRDRVPPRPRHSAIARPTVTAVSYAVRRDDRRQRAPTGTGDLRPDRRGAARAGSPDTLARWTDGKKPIVAPTLDRFQNHIGDKALLRGSSDDVLAWRRPGPTTAPEGG